jgi:plasmid maintenance system antidote protein VapI
MARTPIHPGQILSSELDLSVKRLANAIECQPTSSDGLELLQ